MKRKLPVTQRNRIKNTQKIISSYHTITKNIAIQKRRGNIIEQEKLERELLEMGGINAYQHASLQGGSKDKGWGGAGRWLINQVGNIAKKVLDVGAITGEVYSKTKFEVESIDLNSQSPLVKKADFFTFPPTTQYEIVCLSLVINFVPEPDKRGKMLYLTRKHLIDGGLLYVVLPLPCITNSRYFTHDRFIDFMTSIGYSTQKYHHSKKLAYYLFAKEVVTNLKEFRKEEINSGTKRNNFLITFIP